MKNAFWGFSSVMIFDKIQFHLGTDCVREMVFEMMFMLLNEVEK
jgi:hypothetical protein